ncbi:MAG: hypothetical protein Q9227_006792 [Pyrenula ochraceoflavens]
MGLLYDNSSSTFPEQDTRQNPSQLSLNKQGVSISSNEDEPDSDIEEKPLPSNDTRHGRKLAQSAAFNKLLENEIASAANHDPPSKSNDALTLDSQELPNDLQTAAQLANRGQASKIIDKAREYQTELFERAKTQNLIAVLDTGSGKTLIAVMLLKHILKQEHIDRANGQGRKTAFFLVDSVTLVFQQHAVLANNLDSREIGRLCGADDTDKWEREDWVRQLEQYNVIVCTAEVLAQALLKAFVRMQNVSLLIFDEAHHCHDNHPYARIMKDHYLNCPMKPRIFGMTASPVNAKTDLAQATIRLETLLNARIATTTTLSLDEHVPRPEEKLWEYDELQAPFETDLYKAVRLTCDIPELKSAFTFTKQATSQLGTWCADRIWHYELSSQAAGSIERSIERRLKKSTNPGIISNELRRQNDMPEKKDEKLTKLRSAVEIVAKHHVAEPIFSPTILSPKVCFLWRMLQEYFERPTDTQCIVFVKQRRTALVLADLFQRSGLEHLRCSTLVGIRSGSIEDMHFSFRSQMLTVQSFRKRDINCLFATSVAEEGLDIPSCNLVVRFDLYDTLIEYMQSRGRARRKNSTYAHMLERNNAFHENITSEVRTSEKLLRGFIKKLPEDRLLGSEPYIESMLHKERHLKTVTIKETGAKLSTRSSLKVLEQYANSLQYENATFNHVIYNMKSEGTMFQYQVVLPEESPVTGAIGDAHGSKSLAKQYAAFWTCLALRKQGLLDDHWETTYHKRRPEMANARLAITNKKQHKYAMLTKSMFWKGGSGQIPTHLFVTVIDLRSQKPLSNSMSHLAILTRKPLPEMPTFPVFLEGAVETQVTLETLHDKLQLDHNLFDYLTDFTLKMFDDVFHKSFQRADTIMPYWVAPVKNVQDRKPSIKALGVLNLDMLQEIATSQRIRWRPQMNPETWTERFLVDENSGKYRYFSQNVVPGLGPFSPVPKSLPHRRTRMENILEYTSSLFPNSRKVFVEKADREQPVLSAKLVSLRLNILDKSTEAEHEEESIEYLICPEALELSPFPESFARVCLALPAILSRVESYLIALEATQVLNLSIPASLALEALTKDSDNTEEHQKEQIHVQRGMGKNYERLEFLGDAWLKMATSVGLFVFHPTSDEYDSHVLRMQLICNQNLYDGAVDESLCLTKYIRTQGFNRRTWYPEGLHLLKGKMPNFEASHGLAMKSVADVCEAFLGAAYLTSKDSNNLDMAVQAVSRLVHNDEHSMTAWSDYSRTYSLPSYQTHAADGFDKHLASKILDRLGYEFKYPRLLRSALTHPSDSWSPVPNYQRLEFLGDALFDMVAIEHIFRRFPERDPQWMTEHKMAMVSNKFLAAVAVEIDLDKYLSFNGAAVGAQIASYSKQVRQILQEGGNAVEADYWTVIDHPPKCLSDAVEAYIGAIFIDSDFNFSVVEDFIARYILWHFEDMKLYDTFANAHPTTLLHKRLTDEYGCMEYRLMTGEPFRNDGGVSRIFAGLMIHNSAVSKAFASSGKSAKVKASEEALRTLEGLSLPEFRARYGCDCHRKTFEERIT